MLHLILWINKLMRLVTDELAETSRRSAVSFTLTRRFLEEPALSSLWGKQNSWTDLIKVLLDHGWVRPGHDFESTVSGYDPFVDRIRVDFPRRSNAILQRRIELGFNDTLPGYVGCTSVQIERFPPAPFPNLRKIILGMLCTKLETLRWDVEEIPGALPFFRLSISPSLKLVSLHGSCAFDIPGVWLVGLVQIISIFLTSLEGLAVMYDLGKEECLSDAMSTFVCQCGSALRTLRSCVPLSEAAIRHVTQLPSLRSWAVVQTPPQSIPPSPFPPFEKPRLVGQEALPWLHLLTSHEEGALQNGTAPVTPRTYINESSRSLICPGDTILDSTFLSSILKFRNLVALYVGTCFPTDGRTFRLTDDDVENLAAVLPRLECLQLGYLVLSIPATPPPPPSCRYPPIVRDSQFWRLTSIPSRSSLICDNCWTEALGMTARSARLRI